MLTAIESAAFHNCGLRQLTVPDSVTSIGESAFAGCNSLESITLPFTGASLTGALNTHFGYIFGAAAYGGNTSSVPASLNTVTINGGRVTDNAFAGCRYLRTVTLGEGVTSLGNGAFASCNNLATVNFNAEACLTAGTESSPVFNNCTSLSRINIGSKVTVIPSYLCYERTSLRNISIAENSELKQIGDRAFNGCTGITEAVVPATVTSIGRSAFAGCNSLESITLPFAGATAGGTENTHFGYIFGASRYSENQTNIPATLTKVTLTGGAINANSFYGCNSIAQIILPEDLTAIENSAFENCTGIKTITLPDGITKLGERSFLGSGLESVSIPASVRTVSRSAFSGCTSLKEVTFESNENVTALNAIENSAFFNTPVDRITIPASVTTIGSSAFSGCAQLTELTFEENSLLTSIGAYAFYNCSNIIYLTVPEKVTSIGLSAFGGCNSVVTVIWNAEACLTTGSAEAPVFEGCDGIKTLVISENVLSLPANAFNGCVSVTSLNVPESVASIGLGAFANFEYLEEASIPFIGTALNSPSDSHFGYIFGAIRREENSGKVPSTLKKVTVRNGSPANYAFYGCSQITEISMTGKLTSIGSYAFSGATSLLTLKLAEDNEITQIGERAFNGCTSLTEITNFGDRKSTRLNSSHM